MHHGSMPGGLRAAAVACLSMLLAACQSLPLPLPHDGWRTGHHQGEVRDSVTMQPIYSAKIILESMNAPQHTAMTFSKRNGTFEIGPVVQHEELYVVQLKSVAGYCTDVLTVTHPDYEPLKIDWRVAATATGGFCRGETGNHTIQMVKRR